MYVCMSPFVCLSGPKYTSCYSEAQQLHCKQSAPPQSASVVSAAAAAAAAAAVDAIMDGIAMEQQSAEQCSDASVLFSILTHHDGYIKSSLSSTVQLNCNITI